MQLEFGNSFPNRDLTIIQSLHFGGENEEADAQRLASDVDDRNCNG